jgi:hypothetical protein
MAIPLSSAFNMNSPIPLDERETAVDLITRDAILSGERYEGLTVYVDSEQKTFQLLGGITNSDWVEFGIGNCDGGIWS